MTALSGLSYTSIEYANDFFENQIFNTPWINIETLSGDKRRALITASNLIDDSYSWVGVRNLDISGNLDWPRDGAVNKCTSMDIPNDEIPTDIQDAVAINANFLLGLEQDPYTPSKQVSEGIVEAKLDVMNVKYDLDAIKESQEQGIPRNVALKLNCFGKLKTAFRNFINGYTIRN